MSELKIEGLRAGIEGKEILRGIDITVSSGEVHAVMGPNGSGKSTLAHVLMGHPDYEVYAGSVTLDGADLLALPTWERALAGLFLAPQYPTEVPGVPMEDALVAALRARNRPTDRVRTLVPAEATRIGLDERLLSRPLNVDFSGGEKKRNETVQLVVLEPKIAVLDELDSGLDIDALRAVSRRIQEATEQMNIGVLAITHYSRLLFELHPDVVHVLRGGRIVATGGYELAEELERTGYAVYDDDAA
jgi:Fe-S cluster assembly ATP-binding protein